MLAIADLKKTEAYSGLSDAEKETVEKEWTSRTVVDPLTVDGLRAWVRYQQNLREVSEKLPNEGNGRGELVSKLRALQAKLDSVVRKAEAPPVGVAPEFDAALELLRILLNLRHEERNGRDNAAYGGRKNGK